MYKRQCVPKGIFAFTGLDEGGAEQQRNQNLDPSLSKLAWFEFASVCEALA